MKLLLLIPVALFIYAIIGVMCYKLFDEIDLPDGLDVAASVFWPASLPITAVVLMFVGVLFAAIWTVHELPGKVANMFIGMWEAWRA